MTALPASFLWGASTAPHQVEGNNDNSDWWVYEQRSPYFAHSGDAVDSYHRYREDMQLLADAGLTAYRFGIEWSRIEPLTGEFSHAELAHYRRMIDTAIELGLTSVVTLHHFTSPRWFIEEGGWLGETAIDRFSAYVRTACSILDGVEWVCTINEPNMFAFMVLISRMINSDAVPTMDTPTMQAEGGFTLPSPFPVATARLVEAHRAACDIVHAFARAKVGWTVANLALYPNPGGEARFAEEQQTRENAFLEAARGGDFLGLQAYSTQAVNTDGLVAHTPDPGDTLVGTHTDRTRSASRSGTRTR